MDEATAACDRFMVDLALSQKELSTILFRSPLFVISDGAARRINETAERIGMKPAAILNTAAKYPEMLANLPPDLPRYAAPLGLTRQQAAKLLKEQPSLLIHSPDNIRARVPALLELLDATPKEFAYMVRSVPQYLTYPADMIAQRITEHCKRLPCPKARLLRMLRKCPRLLTSTPTALATNITQAADSLSVSTKDYGEAISREPRLATLSAATLLHRVSETAAAFGVPLPLFMEAALRQPALLTVKAASVLPKARRSARLLGMTVHEFVELALRFQPRLLSANPENLSAKLPYFERLTSLLGVDPQSRDQFPNKMRAMTYSIANIEKAIRLVEAGKATSIGRALWWRGERHGA